MKQGRNMKAKLKKLLLPLLAAVLVLGFISTGALLRLDRWVQDWLYQQRGTPSGEIIIIGIDEETLSELGPYGPNYRMFMAYALEQLASDPDSLPAAVASPRNPFAKRPDIVLWERPPTPKRHQPKGAAP